MKENHHSVVKASVLGDLVRHISANSRASCEISALGFTREDIQINILSPSKLPTTHKIEESNGLFRVEFEASEVGSYLLEATVGGSKILEGPLYFKVYDAGLIRVTDVNKGTVGSPCQFRVDASQAGEGQLEISINDGEVPNNVQVLGGGRCLVHFTPEVPKDHTIDIKFNSEPVKGCPFICHITDASKVSMALTHLELMPVNKKANFQIHVDKSANIELAVSVVGPRSDVPVRVTGNVKSGFTAEFEPDEVGTYSINVECHNKPMGGTPFKAKAYDSSNVLVSPIPWGTIGESLEFTVDASKAGEGNLEITISARGRNIPTQVHPQGSARFAVSFIPLEPVDHIINITFNKDSVPGAPFNAKINSDPNHIEVSGSAISATAVGKSSFFTLSNINPGASVEDVEVIIESPSGDHVPALVQDRGGGSFRAEFCPRISGEHRIFVTYASEPVPGSPFACKVYNVNAIQVRECQKGIVGKPVTFLVETSQAGPGNLEVTVNNGQVPTSAQAQGNHTYAISFIPKEAKPHIVELKFNSENVPGSPFKCLVVDAAKVNMSGDGLEKVPVDRQATFFIDGPPDVGDPEVKILSPYRKNVLNSIRFLAEGHFAVDYTPTTVGDHQVDVKMADLHVQGSPFTVKAYDASKVEVSNITSGVIGKPVFFSIDASQAGAGNLEIIVSVNGKNVPNFVNSEGNAKFQVKFNPVEAKTHTLSVKFNDESVPQSPFECKIRDESNLSLGGSGIKMCPANVPAEFSIDGGGYDPSEVSVIVLSPSNESLPVELHGSPSQIRATYHPTEVGPHNIRLLFNEREANDSPFVCNVYDVSKVVVAGLSRKNRIGKPITFTVDASGAGEGTLELVVSTENSTVRAEVQGRSRGLYDVTFVPQEALSHYVNITFNEESIPNNPFECFVEGPDPFTASPGGVLTDASSDLVLRGDGLKVASVGTNAIFTVDCKMYQENVSVRIVDPRNDVLPERVTELQTGLLRVTYKPEVVGTHVIRMLDHNLRTVGNPHRVDVFDPKRIRVTKVGSAVLGEESKVNVDTSAAGRGALSVIIRAAGQEVRHSIRDLADGRYEILYYPQMAIAHRLDIKYNGYPITSGPLEVKVKNPNFGKVVTASGLGLYQARVSGKPATFTIESLGNSSKEFDITVTGPPDVIPPNEAIPVRCYIQKDGNLMPEFIATSAGVYKIEVLHNRKPIVGSPFSCQSYDPSKVELTNIKEGEHIAGEPIRFHVQRRHAGFAELEVIVTSPLGGDLPIEVKGLAGDKTGDLVEFVPEVAGRYKFLIKYGGEEVPGSPLNFAVQETPSTGGGAPYMPKIFGKGLYSGLVNEVVSFQIDTSGFPPGSPDPSIYISGPNTNAKTSIEKDSNGLLLVQFIPLEVGEFSIQIIFNGSEAVSRIPTYRPKICDVTALKLQNGWNSHLDEDGVMELSQNVEKVLSFDTRRAGPGELEAEVKSEYRRLDSRVETEENNSHVIFTPYDESEHSIDIKWNGYPIKNIPLRGRVAKPVINGRISNGEPSSSSPPPPLLHHAPPETQQQQQQQLRSETINGGSSSSSSGGGGSGVGKVRLTGKGLVSAACDVPNTFLIDGSSAHDAGKPEVQMTGSKSDIGVVLKPLGNNVWQAEYTPTLPGTYLLSVHWSGRQVKGCPLRITAESSGKESKVLCAGEGLRMGTLGKDIRSFIDTRQAGPGELTLHCIGPHGKTAYCELKDHQDGTFSLNIKPQESGKHNLSIKYGGKHVPGSPFNLKVAGAPDPSRVRVYGPGIEHGVLAMYQSRFICDTRGAGAGQLSVRMKGPKGAFRVEMQRESQKDRTILCKYEPTEPGDYRIDVRWSGKSVPGSPFVVMIFDTQEELTKFMQTAPSYSPNGHSDVYGSIGNFGNNNSSSYGHNTLPWRGSQGQLN